MKRFVVSLSAALLCLTASAAEGVACSEVSYRPVRVVSPAPTPVPIANDPGPRGAEFAEAPRETSRHLPSPQPGGAPRRAPLPQRRVDRSGAPSAVRNESVSGSPSANARATVAPSPREESPAGESRNDQILRLVALQQALVAQTATLEGKLADLERWDAQTQEKFHRAFGTTDEAMRQRVLQRVHALIERNRQSLAGIAEDVNFQFYMESRKQR